MTLISILFCRCIIRSHFTIQQKKEESFMRNMKIRFRMLLGFGILLFLIILLNGVSLVNLRKISNFAVDLYEGPYVDTIAALTLTTDLYQMESSVQSMITSVDDTEYEQAYQAAKKEAEACLSVLAEQSLNEEQTSSIRNYLNAANSSYENIGRISGDRAIKEFQDQFSKSIHSAVTIAKNIVVENENSAAAFKENAVKRTNQNVLFQDILFIIIVVSAIYISLRMALNITRPVKKLAEGMEEISNGHFNVDLSNPYGDEIGVLTRQLDGTIGNIRDYIYDITHLLKEVSQGNITLKVDRDYVGEFGAIKDALNLIIDSLNHTMEQIRQCANEVEIGAQNLSKNSQTLADGAMEQSNAIEEFKTSLDKAAVLTEQDGQNAAKVKEISISACSAVEQSDLHMEEMIISMAEIDDSAKEIEKVIKIIDDIAFQTNILALNAAVEAARAGNAGKGFAVVADEVRNLASKSAEAASNTTEMIKRSIESVNKGQETAIVTAESLQVLKENVTSMRSYLEEIDKSTEEQGEAFHNMLSALNQFISVVHANSSAAEANSSASEELSSQVKILNDMVNRFKTRNSEVNQGF